MKAAATRNGETKIKATEHSHGFRETHPMFPFVRIRLDRIPLEFHNLMPLSELNPPVTGGD